MTDDLLELPAPGYDAGDMVDSTADFVIRTEALAKNYTLSASGPGPTEATTVAAVAGVDLAVRRGEIFGLLGPNGAGKTTTVGMLTTRIIPSAGRAMVNGIDVVVDPAGAKQFIGMVPENNTLDRSLTVWENLYFHGRYFGMKAKASSAAADEFLERFRLTDRAKAPVEALSKGMAQRLMLARALLHRPAVLFLDEPTAGLDPQSRLAMWEVMGELHQAGETILLTTHYMEEADQFCDRVAIMDRGRILALDTPTRLKASLRGGVTVTVSAVGDLDLLAERLGRMVGATDAKRLDDTVRVHLPSAEGALPKVIAAAQRGGFKVTQISARETTLETVFISLTGKDLRD